MKKLTPKEYKTVLLELLDYFDQLCRSNNIKYTLTGGSLIGAIRHKGIIPWDDDIDVALMPEEYQKLQKAIAKSHDDRYRFLTERPFIKLVDTRTCVLEGNLKTDADYGVFLDIFQYIYVSDCLPLAKLKYRRVKAAASLFYLSTNTHKYWSNPVKKIVAIVARCLGPARLSEHFLKTLKSKKATNRVLISWPAYSAEKSFQSADSFNKCIDCTFEQRQAMITADYDRVLRQTFGDYMQLPPKNQRKNHDINAYWKEGDKK